MSTEEGKVWKDTLAQSGGGVAFLRNGMVQILLCIAFIPILLAVGVLMYFVRPSEASLVLHYNVYFGVDLLGVWWQAYALPLLGLVFFGGHFFLAQRFYKSTERIACYLMILSAGMLSSGVLLAAVSIAFINY